MDWALVIDRNRTALKPIVDVIFALLGLVGNAATATRISRGVHRNVLRLLQPTESAVRRLIVIAARGLVVKVAPSRPKPSVPILNRRKSSRISFQLFDPRKRFAMFQKQQRRRTSRVPPRIHVFGYDPRVAALWPTPRPPAPPAAPPPDGRVDAARLGRRLPRNAGLDDEIPLG